MPNVDFAFFFAFSQICPELIANLPRTHWSLVWCNRALLMNISYIK